MEVGTQLTSRRSAPYQTVQSILPQLTEQHGTVNGAISALFVRAYVALLFDTPLPCVAPARVRNRFERQLLTDMKGIIATYASLGDRIDATCVYTSDSTITGEFLNELQKTPVFPEYLHFYKTGDPASLQFVKSFLWFGKKLDYNDPTLDPIAFRDWEKKEQEMANLVLEDSVTSKLAEIMRVILQNFDDSVLLPKFGSGAVADVKSLDPAVKFDNLQWDEKLGHTFRMWAFLESPHFEREFPYIGEREGQVSKLTFVPKTYKARRTICMEPNAYMYFQQEILRWFADSIRRSPIGMFVTLEDQRHNQRFALAGSANYQVDTIDLSKASDSVHADLVEAVFSSQQVYYLMGTRSNVVEIPREFGGGTRIIAKFAPMGSAVCFPTQCAIFTAITLLAYLMHSHGIPVGGDPSTLPIDKESLMKFLRRLNKDPFACTRRYTQPRIYGDDIICDTRVTNHVLDLLGRCGLTVNTDKSFVGGQMVRESCGIFAYNGHDVTPVLFRVRSFEASMDAASFSSLVSMINRLKECGYVNLRSFLIQYLQFEGKIGGIREDRIRRLLPFQTNPDNFGIVVEQLQLANCEVRDTSLMSSVFAAVGESRSDNWYMRDEVKRLVLINIKQTQDGILDDAYAYDQWMRARIRGGSPELTQPVPRIRPSLTRVRERWTPL